MGGLARRYPLLAAAFTVGVLAIAGIPPFNGYVSLGLIHGALRSSRQIIPYAAMLVAQVLTLAALGKAAWQALFRSRPDEAEFERDERLHPGMAAALVLLSAGCIAFGVLPYPLLHGMSAPAAGSLLHPALYAGGVLASSGILRPAEVAFTYFDPGDLLTVLGTVILAVPVARAGMRWAESSPVTFLRRVQTGSANDYASYLVGGVILTIGVVSGGVLFR